MPTLPTDEAPGSEPIRGSMGHGFALRLAALIVALTLAACGGSTLTSEPPSFAVPPTAIATALPTIAASATSEPSSAATATPQTAPTGRILFSAVVPTDTFASIFLMKADGSGVTNLTGTRGGDEPAWSPDGTMVAFVRSGIWVMHADGSQARQIRHERSMVEEWPVWSPDGRQIAYVETPECTLCSIGITWALNVMNADGSGLRKVADTPSDGRPAWSPDGQSIVFGGRWDDPPSAANGLQSIRLDGSGLHQLTDGPDWSPAWSPDGRFAFLRGVAPADGGTIVFSLFIANADGSAPNAIKLPIVVGPSLAWSTDGGWVALAGAETQQLVLAGKSDVWIVRPDGSGALNLTKSSTRAEGSPAWH